MTDNRLDVAAVLQDLAPTGVLRVAVNFGNIVLVQTDPATGQPKGIVPALARELASRLGVKLQIIAYPRAGAVFDSIREEAWEVCFLAIEPARAAEVAFTAPYVLIEGTYLVDMASPPRTTADLDRPGIRIAVATGSAYELFLTRTLKQATLVRTDGLPASGEFFRNRLVDAIAGVRQPLDLLAQQIHGTQVMADPFMIIEQACGTRPGHPAGLFYLEAFIEDTKQSGFVQRALTESGQHGATVAPLRQTDISQSVEIRHR